MQIEAYTVSELWKDPGFVDVSSLKDYFDGGADKIYSVLNNKTQSNLLHNQLPYYEFSPKVMCVIRFIRYRSAERENKIDCRAFCAQYVWACVRILCKHKYLAQLFIIPKGLCLFKRWVHREDFFVFVTSPFGTFGGISVLGHMLRTLRCFFRNMQRKNWTSAKIICSRW